MRQFTVTAEPKPKDKLYMTQLAAEGDLDGVGFDFRHGFGLGGAFLLLYVDDHEPELMDLRPLMEAWVKEVTGRE